MKQFLQIFIVTLIFTWIFLFFGGYRLFDLSHNYYGAGAAYAFLIAVVINGFLVQSDRIDALEKRLQAMEQDKEAGLADETD